MKSQKIPNYQAALEKIPQEQYAWPLYGAGLQNLGKDGKPVLVPVPEFSDAELLARIDAVSLCYTDTKEIDQAQNHPRLIGRDLKSNPVIPGHEVSMTVVGVGRALASDYRIGDKITLQPDVWVNGKSVPFCFDMDGGYRQYTKIGREILDGDAGNYLIRIPDDMTYAAGAITEPWACVEAAYRMSYRKTVKNGGSLLVWGNAASRRNFKVDEKWLLESKPVKISLCEVPEDLSRELQMMCKKNDIGCEEIPRQSITSGNECYDDIILLDAPANDIFEAADHMKNDAIMALMNDGTMSVSIEIDLGRLHYDNILYVGTSSSHIQDAYRETTARAELKSGGSAWILGAGGPMGRMHLQRAIETRQGPKRIVATEVNPSRLNALIEFFEPLARRHGKKLDVINPVENQADYHRLMNEIKAGGGFDDIEVMVTATELVVESCKYLAKKGSIINLFAGVKRGVKVKVDAELIYGESQVRFIGHSGSGLDDQKAVVDRAINGQLKPELSVAAIGGLCQIHDGIKAMAESRYPGKIVIYPQIFDFPLTSLKEMRTIFPDVYQALDENYCWTLEAELIFLENVLA